MGALLDLFRRLSVWANGDEISRSSSILSCGTTAELFIAADILAYPVPLPGLVLLLGS